MTDPRISPSPFPVLIARSTLLTRIQELADSIRRSFPDAPPLLVAVMEGARVFARELQKLLPGQPVVHEIRASSYGDGQHSSGRVQISGAQGLDVQGRDVLLLEDIVDTGRTIATLRQHFAERGARSVRVSALLSKPSRRVVPVEIDYLGFEIEDKFVIGFGMDVAGKYRELPEIVIYGS